MTDRLIYYPNPEWWDGMPTVPTRLEVMNTILDDNNVRPALTVYDVRGGSQTMLFWGTVTMDELNRRFLVDEFGQPAPKPTDTSGPYPSDASTRAIEDGA